MTLQELIAQRPEAFVQRRYTTNRTGLHLLLSPTRALKKMGCVDNVYGMVRNGDVLMVAIEDASNAWFAELPAAPTIVRTRKRSASNEVDQ